METLHTMFAYAKINLGLAIVGLRGDGYHELQSVMQSIELHDVIEVERVGNSLVCHCAELSGPGNLAYQAADLFIRRIGVKDGITIKINKQLPLQAGLAGGSSDAAATLRLLNEMYLEPLSIEELKELAKMCGSDVSFCLTGGTMWATGRGEELEGLPSPPKLELILVKPQAGIDTREAYRRFDAYGQKGCLSKVNWRCVLERGQIQEIAQLMSNDFELVSIQLVPEISLIKQELILAGCHGALMSGSGSTVFGIAQDKEHADWVARTLQKKGFDQVWRSSSFNA